MLRAFQFRRLAGVTILLLAGFAWLEYRLVVIQIVRHEELRRKAEKFTRTTRFSEPSRGEIRDRQGTPLAVPFPAVAVYANLPLCSNRADQVAHALAPLLQLRETELADELRFHTTRSSAATASGPKKAIVLKRHLPLSEWQTITNALAHETFGLDTRNLRKRDKALLAKLRRKVLFAEDEQLRLYPYGDSLAHVLGYVTVATNRGSLRGVCGVEGSFNKVLAGVRGRCVSQQDAAGNELPDCRTYYAGAQDGNHIALTIDLRVQQLVEQALAEAMRQYAPRSASVIVVRPRTGEILAWAVLPNFSPQNPGASPPAAWRNRPLSDMMEPGSTFKIITLAAALNERLLTLEYRIFCENGAWRTREFAVHDHARYGWLLVRQAFGKSINVAFAKIATLLGRERFHRYILAFGFGQPTGIALAAETPGRVTPPLTWKAGTLATIGFGQGIAVSQLQMTMALAAIANDGVLMRPLLVSRVESPQGQVVQQFHPQAVRAVIRPEVARQVTSALRGVVSREGTGALAAVDGLDAVGKTGTAQKSDGHRYLPGCNYMSFIGFFPADAPEVCISVALDEPQKGTSAGAVAAPVFHTIAERIAPLLNLPPPQAQPVPTAGSVASLRALRLPAAATNSASVTRALPAPGPQLARASKP